MGGQRKILLRNLFTAAKKLINNLQTRMSVNTLNFFFPAIVGNVYIRAIGYLHTIYLPIDKSTYFFCGAGFAKSLQRCLFFLFLAIATQ
jgi:hypothetical protein